MNYKKTEHVLEDPAKEWPSYMIYKVTEASKKLNYQTKDGSMCVMCEIQW
jgi:hypothetical protein